MPLIKRKYPYETIAMGSPLEGEAKTNNILFICIVANGHPENLKRLFSLKTKDVLIQLAPIYQLKESEKETYQHCFPKRYKMDDTVKANALGLVRKYSAERHWDAETKYQMTKILIQRGVAPYIALFDKNISLDVLHFYIDCGADVNSVLRGFTALHSAVLSPHDRAEKVAFLVKKKINVNSLAMEPPVGTALHLAIANEEISRSLELIELTKRYYNPNLKDGEEKTPLLLAAKIRCPQIVVALLENFPDIDVNATDKISRTALHFACAYGDLETVTALVSKGASVDAPDHRGNTPLHYANAKLTVIRAMFESIEIHPDRDVKARRNAISDIAHNPILLKGKEVLATKTNIRENLSALLQQIKRADHSHQSEDIEKLKSYLTDFKGKSLIASCIDGHKAVVEYLLQHSGNVLVQNTNGNRASAIAQDPEIKALLLEYEAKAESNASIESTEELMRQHLA